MNRASFSVLRKIFACAALLLCVNAAFAQFPSHLNISLVASNKPAAANSYGDVWGDGDIACLGVWGSYSTFGFGIYNIANPASPQLLKIFNYSSNPGNRFEQGVIRSNILYVGSWGGSGNGSGLHIYSLANPASPALLSRITASTPGTITGGFNDVHTLFLDRDFIYEAAHNAGILSVKVFNITNPAAPVFLHDIVTTNTTKVHQMTVRTNAAGRVILYTSGWGGNDNGAPQSPGQTDIWDVTDIGSQPALWLGRIFAGYNSHSSWPSDDGNTLIVCREMPGGDVKLYDISNPASVTSNTPPLCTITPASMGLEDDIPHNPVVISNFLFLSWYQNGLQVFDITDRTRPVRIGFFDTYSKTRSASYQGNWGVYPQLGFDRVLLSDIQGGFLIVNATALLTPTNNYPPLIVQPPASLTVTQAHTATFTPVITGSQLKYQWRFNGANLPNATNSSLVLENVQTNQAGNYSVVVSNASGMATSAVAVLSVAISSSAPAITSQPENISVYPENAASFSVGVSGEAPFSFQWRFNGADIAGATNSEFFIPSVESQQVGEYSVVVSNAFGTTTSTNAWLTLLDSPYINNVGATPGTRSALISWNTTVPSDSRVQFETSDVVIENIYSAAAARGSFGAASYLDPALATNHVILLTGLEPDTRYSFQTLSSDGTNTYVSGVYQFVTPGTNIMDNVNADFTGSWTIGTSSVDKYSTNYHFANSVTGSATAIATWRPNIVTPGKYEVYIWYPQGGNRANNAPYFISFNGGTTNVLVNQQNGGGDWRLIATVDFAKGTNGFVRLSNNANPSVVIADAVRFVYVESQDFPTNATAPMWWQNFYFGGATDASFDFDGDGYTTAQEFVMGTNPTNAASHLELAAATQTNPFDRITFWPMLANREYDLLCRTNLAFPVWQKASVTEPTQTDDGRGEFALGAATDPQAYFRLKVQLSTNSGGPGTMALRSALSPFTTEAACGPYRVYIK